MQKLKFFLLAAMIALPAYAQSTTSGQDQDADSAETITRPEMPDLFFRNEQRRVLEAVRQGFVEQSDFDIEEFVPVVIVEEALPDSPDAPVEVRTRSEDLYFDAYIVNRSSGQRWLWVNGEQLDLEKDADILANQGIVVTGLEEDSGKGGVLSGDDTFTNSRFKAQVGQVIGTNGAVDETLPIIIRKN